MRFNRFLLQLFADNAFDGGAYCDFSSSAAKALAGKDIRLAVYNADGSKLIAIGTEGADDQPFRGFHRDHQQGYSWRLEIKDCGYEGVEH
nr:hypothetical protein [uncultured Schaedlerella sp.]